MVSGVVGWVGRHLVAGLADRPAGGVPAVSASLFFGVSPGDAAVYAMVVLATLGVGLVAARVPARRAARVDPLTALRTE